MIFLTILTAPSMLQARCDVERRSIKNRPSFGMFVFRVSHPVYHGVVLQASMWSDVQSKIDHILACLYNMLSSENGSSVGVRDIYLRAVRIRLWLLVIDSSEPHRSSQTPSAFLSRPLSDLAALVVAYFSKIKSGHQRWNLPPPTH